MKLGIILIGIGGFPSTQRKKRDLLLHTHSDQLTQDVMPFTFHQENMGYQVSNLNSS